MIKLKRYEKEMHLKKAIQKDYKTNDTSHFDESKYGGDIRIGYIQLWIEKVSRNGYHLYSQSMVS
jgi:hypothetical protein